jgi:ferredoxin/flavodoxin---NADP+ reductase
MIAEGNSMRRVLGLRSLSYKAYVLRMERGEMTFVPGQHITLGLHGDTDLREYSLYSAPGEPFLEVLITETDPGLVSRKLRRLLPGDRVAVNGPYGFFVLPQDNTARVLAVATGTGIAPFHSMCSAFPERDILVLHGIRETSEAYDRRDYRQYVSCTSRSTDGDFHGRVTAYLQDYELAEDTYVYLCGNCEMIYAVYDMLQAKGLPPEQIKTEVYF